MNNPKYLNMSDAQLISHIADLAKNLVLRGDGGHRLSELKSATEELDLRVNRS